MGEEEGEAAGHLRGEVEEGGHLRQLDQVVQGEGGHPRDLEEGVEEEEHHLFRLEEEAEERVAEEHWMQWVQVLVVVGGLVRQVLEEVGVVEQ